ncbi:Fc.00g025620.m01.CDS01 [Cosmosporella sp. VM-42]
MVSENVLELCQDLDTVSSVLAKHPEEAPGDIVKQLYGSHTKYSQPKTDANKPVPTPEVLEKVFKCGSWGSTKPSRLFLQAFADALDCLDTDPTLGMVSPPLMGSHGTLPLTVIAPLADIVRHCSNLIVRAEREVFFITCEWSPSIAQQLVKDALVELSRRAGERGQRVIVKMMYDKPGPAHAIAAHQPVKPATYTSKSIQLPSPEEIPNLNLEVMTLHKAVLGTLHAKFCVVDRKVAAVMSNNMEDNDNMEMMTHVEGPIVDSIYDAALITWSDHFHPPLPSHDVPATEGGVPAFSKGPHYLERGSGRAQDEVTANGQAKAGRFEHKPHNPHYDSSLSEEITRMQAIYSTKRDETRLEATNRQLNLAVKRPIEPTGPQILKGDEFIPYISTSTPYPIPIALVNRPPYGCLESKSIRVPQNEAWVSLIRNASHHIFIQTPDLNGAPLISALAEALKRGVEVTYYVCFGYNDPGEVIPGQGGTNEQAAQALINSLPPGSPERSLLHIYDYVGKDQDHPIHQSFKSRSCHIKLLIVDNAVGIQGSGNQDTQSWFHSQEINIMVDSQEICERWRKGIDRNQNTKAFGKVSGDGVWRDKHGQPGEGYMGDPGLVKGLIKGVWGMFRKMNHMGGA